MLKPRNAAFAKSFFLIGSYRNGACTLPVFLALAWKETFCSCSIRSKLLGYCGFEEEAKKYAIEVPKIPPPIIAILNSSSVFNVYAALKECCMYGRDIKRKILPSKS
jgi:hypothetical protein